MSEISRPADGASEKEIEQLETNYFEYAVKNNQPGMPICVYW